MRCNPSTFFRLTWSLCSNALFVWYTMESVHPSKATRDAYSVGLSYFLQPPAKLGAVFGLGLPCCHPSMCNECAYQHLRW